MSKTAGTDKKKKKRIPRHEPYYYRRIRRGILRALLMAALAGMLCLFSVWKAGTMTEQQAAQRWETEGGYAQISVFFPSGKGMSPDDTMAFKAQLLQRLASDSVISTDSGSGNNPVRDCYSTSETVELRAGHSLASAEAIYTGGGFFVFHPVMLLSGSYYRQDNLSNDHILLDEETAWALFGAYDVEDRTVSIGDNYYVIAGVFRKPVYGFPIRSVSSRPVVFVPFGSGQTAAEGSSGSSGSSSGGGNGTSQGTDGGKEITSYEILVPNPVDGYARSAVLNMIGRDESEVVCVDNTARYTWMGLLNKLLSLGSWGIRTAPVQFPYWENAALSLEEILAALLLMAAVLAASAVTAVIKTIVFIYTNRKWSLAGSIHAMQETVYRKQSERLYPEYYAREEQESRTEEEPGLAGKDISETEVK